MISEVTGAGAAHSGTGARAWAEAGARTAGSVGGRGEEFEGVSLADGGTELFRIFERLQFGLLVGGEEAGGLFAEFGVGGVDLFANRGDFEDGFADSSGIGGAIGDGRLERLLLGSRLVGEGLIGGAGGGFCSRDGADLGVREVEVGLQLGEGGGRGRGLREADGGGEESKNDLLFHDEFRWFSVKADFVIRSLCTIERGRPGRSWLRIG